MNCLVLNMHLLIVTALFLLWLPLYSTLASRTICKLCPWEVCLHVQLHHSYIQDTQGANHSFQRFIQYPGNARFSHPKVSVPGWQTCVKLSSCEGMHFLSYKCQCCLVKGHGLQWLLPQTRRKTNKWKTAHNVSFSNNFYKTKQTGSHQF